MKNIRVIVQRMKVNKDYFWLSSQLNNLARKVELNFNKREIMLSGVKDENEERVISLIKEKYTISNIEVLFDTFTAHKECEETKICSKAESILRENSELFENYHMCKKITQLLNVCSNALCNKEVNAQELGRHLTAAERNISNSYLKNDKKVLKIEVGDLVLCDYGKSIRGEIEGTQTLAIVYKTYKEAAMAYLLPVLKVKLKSQYDVAIKYSNLLRVYSEKNCERLKEPNLCIRVDYGSKLSCRRIFNVIGHVKESKMASITKTFEKFIKLPKVVTKKEISKENTENNKKVINLDDLRLYFEKAFSKMSEYEEVKAKATIFLLEIGMLTKDRFECEMLIQSFIAASELKKITYNEVIWKIPYTLCDRLVVPKEVKEIIKEIFQKWLLERPEISENYNISIVHLWKVFAKNL